MPHAKKQFDGEIDSTLIEVTSGLNAVRNLRAGLLDLAYALQDGPRRRGLLVLSESNISHSRLEKEWQLATQTLRPDLISRLGILVVAATGAVGYPAVPSSAVLARIEQLIRKDGGRDGLRLPSPDYAPEILKVLILEWLRKNPALTSVALQKIVGCTYPTVAKALQPLAPHLRRNSDRSFTLAHFPKEAWSALLARGNEVRQTVRYADRSGRPRSPDRLARKLARLGRGDIAIGGVLGARYHHPALDLIGTPRRDVTVHCPGNRWDPGFVARLDPGLAPLAAGDAPPMLVVHFIRRQASFYSPLPDGGWCADPVECLLDLHEARLESQAAQFLRAMTAGLTVS